MIDNLVDIRFVPLFLLSLLTFTFLVQMWWHWFFYWKLVRRRPAVKEEKQKPVSVVICAHNEYAALKENLPLILEQDYPDFEVVVVDHASDDDTRYLLSYLVEKYPHLKTFTVHEDLNFFSGKKFPLSIGIKSASREYILLTEPTCRPDSNQWIHRMQSAFTPKTSVVLGFAPFLKQRGFLNKLIRFDADYTAIRYLSLAMSGIPYMGVGRNLSYRKQLFYDNNGFIAHYRIMTGDDDLFVNKVATRHNTAVMIDPDSFIYSVPRETFGAWMKQKRQYISTFRFYRFSHRFLLGFGASAYPVFMGLLMAMLILQWSVIPVIGLFLLRQVSQLVVMNKCLHKLREPDLIPLVPLFEFLLFFINSYVMITGIFRKRK